MKLNITIGGKTRAVEITRTETELRAAVDGREIRSDAIEIAPGTFSILTEGKVYEARVEPFAGTLRIQIGGEEFVASVEDPRRWQRGDRANLASQGRQNVVAPMPGKIVRLLVKAGEPIEAGQGLLVVEAMKMQNEVRSPKAGKVEKLAVAEGQAVNAGDVLAVVG